MKHFEVGYEVASGVFSVNVISANTGREEYEAACETAQRRAKRFGYSVAYLKEITPARADECARKGIPFYPVDDQAEQAHDPSFSE